MAKKKDISVPESVPPMVQILRDFWLWVGDGKCIIKSDRTPDGVPRLMPLKPNRLQVHLYTKMIEQAYRNQPIRIIGLKGRKGGFSTWVEALAYFIVKNNPQIYAQVIAHTDPSTRDIFEIAGRIYVNDPDWAHKPKFPEKHTIDFTRMHDSKLNTRTFGGQYVSSSATINVEHISELAKVEGDPATVADQMQSLLNAVPGSPMSIIVIESTANRADKSGQFEKRFREAQRGEGSFEAAFMPWFWETSYRSQGPPLKPLLDQKEREAEELARDTYGLDEEQLRWRRKQIVDQGGRIRFEQDFPSSIEEAFQVAAGKVFPSLREKTHTLCVEPGALLSDGYQIYRGFDWGGRDPFVCITVAHKVGRARFTIDVPRCPNLWRELTGWIYDDNGRPVDRDNHGIDALRYVVTKYNMTGHVHVFQEMFDFNFAAEGRWIADNAQAVKRAHADWPIAGSVGDRSRPDCIAAFRSQGVQCIPYVLDTVRAEQGEVLYGVDRLNELIVASFPIVYEPEPPPPMEQEERTNRRRGMFGFGFCSLEHMHALTQHREQQRIKRRAG